MKNTQPEFPTLPLNGKQNTLPSTSEETLPLEVTEMSLEDVMLFWDGQTSEFNSELRNRPETSCYGYWQKKLAEKQREKEEA